MATIYSFREARRRRRRRQQLEALTSQAGASVEPDTVKEAECEIDDEHARELGEDWGECTEDEGF